jgi:hypothetical protein
MKAHSPEEENHRGKEHDIKDEVFVHFFRKNAERRAQRA